MDGIQVECELGGALSNHHCPLPNHGIKKIINFFVIFLFELKSID